MTITVYEKDDCTQCTSTKRHLERRGLQFEVADLMEPGNLEAAKALGYLAAPVVVAGDEHWSGFRPDKIDELVKRLDAEEGK